MTRRTVFFQGAEMDEGWPKRILEAQSILTYTIDGRELPRIPYGKEPGSRRSVADHNCHDCGVIRGQLHVPSCDMERCPACRGQVLTCVCLGSKS